MFLNPAGLGYMFYQELALSYNNLYNSGIYNGFISFATPFKNYFKFAINYEYFYFDDNELNVNNNLFQFTLAKKLFLDNLLFGITTKFSLNSIKLDNNNVSDNFNMYIDAGIIYHNFKFIHSILETLAFGIYLKNILNLPKTSDMENVFSNFKISYGVSYIFMQQLTGEFDIYPDSYNFGVEYWFTFNNIINLFRKIKLKSIYSFSDRFLALRFGLILDKLSGNLPDLTLGLGINYLMINFNIGYIYNLGLKSDLKYSLSYKFGFGSSYIKIAKANIDNLFTSLYKSYRNSSIGYIKLKNNSKNILQVNVSLFIKDFMDAPTTKEISIRPNSTFLVPLNAVFSKKIMKTKDDTPTQAVITYTYVYNKKKVTREIIKQFIMYGRNAITWRNRQQIAVFITPKDPIISQYTRKIIQSYGDKKSGFLPENVEKAMIIFNTLKVLGITYIKDPNGPFGKESVSGDFIDNIQFPSETLRFKSGDCDDTSVLFASMLESIGINTALIDIPQHVFMMFNTGVLEENKEEVSSNPNDYLIKDGMVWIAIETTMIKDGFFKAWKEAMFEYNKWTKN